MTATQPISNLSTIVRSETRKFMKAIEKWTDLSLFGQFYVGFFQHFWLRAEFLSHQNIMMANKSGKVREIKT
jgi:HSP90 family molecular chaperone